MADHPTSTAHGPIKVHFTDTEEPKEFDRYWQMNCGLLMLFDYEEYGPQQTDAIAVPVDRIEKLEYLGW